MTLDDMIPYDIITQATERRNKLKDIEANTFNPLTDIPTNDEQAEIAIKFGKDPITGSCGYGLYKIYRERDNTSVIQAYERALLAMLPEKRTPIL